MTKQPKSDGEALLTPSTSPLAPKQRRSRLTFEHLLDAGAALIVERGFDGTPINEICRRANVSVGAFYRRFASKDELLHAVHERWTQDNLLMLAEAFDTQRWKDTSIGEALHRVLAATMRVGRRDEALTRATLVRCFTDTRIAERESRVRDELHRSLVSLLRAHITEIAHPNAEAATEFAAYEVVAAFNYRLNFPLRPYADDEFTDDQFVELLCGSVLASLHVKKTRRAKA